MSYVLLSFTCISYINADVPTLNGISTCPQYQHPSSVSVGLPISTDTQNSVDICWVNIAVFNFADIPYPRP